VSGSRSPAKTAQRPTKATAASPANYFHPNRPRVGAVDCAGAELRHRHRRFGPRIGPRGSGFAGPRLRRRPSLGPRGRRPPLRRRQNWPIARCDHARRVCRPRARLGRWIAPHIGLEYSASERAAMALPINASAVVPLSSSLPRFWRLMRTPSLPSSQAQTLLAEASHRPIGRLGQAIIERRRRLRGMGSGLGFRAAGEGMEGCDRCLNCAGTGDRARAVLNAVGGWARFVLRRVQPDAAQTAAACVLRGFLGLGRCRI
jgi:hypothetical protein